VSRYAASETCISADSTDSVLRIMRRSSKNKEGAAPSVGKLPKRRGAISQSNTTTRQDMSGVSLAATVTNT